MRGAERFYGVFAIHKRGNFNVARRDHDDVDAALGKRVEEFLRDARLMETIKSADIIKNNSLCALGQTAPNPVLSTYLRFKDEYIAHVRDKTCPAGVCKGLLKFVIDKDACIGCGLCAKNCPANAISKTDYVAPGHKLPSYVIDTDKCVKCGVCMTNCKKNAISKK